MSSNFFSAAATAILLTIALFGFAHTAQAQDYDWSQDPNAQEMYNDLMNNVDQSYQQSYDENMRAANQIIEQQAINEQQYYNELMDLVNTSYAESYAQYQAMFDQIIANANADAAVMQAQLMAQGATAYQQALARGMSDAAAQQAAVQTIGNIASTNSVTSSFGHDLTMKIMNNYPNGSGALYRYADGTYGNWATRY